MSELTFTVPGIAVPKGSRSYFRGRSVESSRRWPAWKVTVSEYAVQAKATHRMRGVFAGAVTLTCTFLLPKPQRRVDPNHITRPDLDKMVRGICDALTGVAWVDDSQVDTILAVKRYAHDDEEPGVLIRVADTLRTSDAPV